MLEEQGAQGTQRTAWLSQGGDVLGRLPGRALREDGAACAGHSLGPAGGPAVCAQSLSFLPPPFCWGTTAGHSAMKEAKTACIVFSWEKCATILRKLSVLSPCDPALAHPVVTQGS